MLGVRPEHVRLGGGALPGRVRAVEYLGTTQIVTLTTPNGEIKARTASTERVGVNESVGLGFATQTLSLFDEGTGRSLPLAHAAEREVVDG